MIHQSDMCAPPDTIAYYKTDKYKKELAKHVEHCHKNLDTGFGDRIMRGPGE